MLFAAPLPASLWAADDAPPSGLKDAPLVVTPLHCRDGDGNSRQLGEVICITASCQTWMARCERSLNVTTWRKLQDGCPAVSAQPSLLDRLDPARRALGVHAQISLAKS